MKIKCLLVMPGKEVQKSKNTSKYKIYKSSYRRKSIRYTSK